MFDVMNYTKLLGNDMFVWLLKRIPKMSWVLRVKKLPTGTRFTWGFIFFKREEGVMLTWLLMFTSTQEKKGLIWALRNGKISKTTTKINQFDISGKKVIVEPGYKIRTD